MTSQRGNLHLHELETVLGEYDWHEFLEDVDQQPEEAREIISPSIEDSFVFSEDRIFTRDGQSKFTLLEVASSSESVITILTSDAEKEEEEEEKLIVQSIGYDSRLCLTESNVDDSHLKLFNYCYPIPEDPGIVPAFWILYPNPSTYETDGVKKFTDLITTMKLQPIRKISQMLKTDEINLRYYNLNPRAVRAICEALFYNTNVKSVDLKDNWLDIDACFHLNELLVNNKVLTSLNLSGCLIGPDGAKRLQEGIGAAPSLLNLNLSRCNLEDKGLQCIAIGVYCSSSLLNVDLSGNRIGLGSGAAFQTMLTQTDTVTRLNLSWNSLFSKEFWAKFIVGLNRNTTLDELDMSWNGLGKDCIPFLEKYLSVPSSLRKLNIRGC